MITYLRLLLFTLTCACTFTVAAREVERLEQINRDLDVIENVFRSAMREAAHDRVRISNVRSDYLARQGVLVTMDVSASWISINRFNNDINIDADIQSLAEIPEMIRDILSELKLAVAPYEPQELEELRALRTEQHDIRRDRRKISRSLHNERLQLARTTDEDDQADIEERIEELKAERDAPGARGGRGGNLQSTARRRLDERRARGLGQHCRRHGPDAVRSRSGGQSDPRGGR